MKEIKSKKRLRRIAKIGKKQVAIPQWISDFHKIFGYYPLPGFQEFFDTHILAAEQRGREAGIIEESKAHQDLIDAVSVWHALWMQDPEEKGKEAISPLGLINWKLRSEFKRGKLEANNPQAIAASLPEPQASPPIQGPPQKGGRKTAPDSKGTDGGKLPKKPAGKKHKKD